MSVTLPLSQGQVAIIDNADYERVSQWTWYAQWNRSVRSYFAMRKETRNGRRRVILLHREILGLSIDDPRHVDHKNHNPLDNRRENLRPCTQSENQANRRAGRNNTSGFKGVCFHKASGKFAASIQINGKRKHLGLFRRPAEAGREYNRAATELFGEFALLNAETNLAEAALYIAETAKNMSELAK